MHSTQNNKKFHHCIIQQLPYFGTFVSKKFQLKNVQDTTQKCSIKVHEMKQVDAEFHWRIQFMQGRFQTCWVKKMKRAVWFYLSFVLFSRCLFSPRSEFLLLNGSLSFRDWTEELFFRLLSSSGVSTLSKLIARLSLEKFLFADFFTSPMMSDKEDRELLRCLDPSKSPYLKKASVIKSTVRN